MLRDSLKKKHVARELSGCSCVGCSLRHLGGVSEDAASEGVTRETRGSMLRRGRSLSGFSVEMDSL